MQQYYEKSLIIGPSVIDADHLLSHAATFNLLQDVATEHAMELGMGLNALSRRSLFWLLVKAKIVFDKRPQIEDRVVLRTWPQAPGALRCDRSFSRSRGGETLIRARYEFAIFNTAEQRVVPAPELFPPELTYELAPALDEPYVRIPGGFKDTEPFARYTVTSSDIDLGGHMNNAAYPRALFGCFSVADRRAYDLRCIDMIFRSPCYEGETLEFRRRDHDGVLDLRASRGDETVLLARLEPKK